MVDTASDMLSINQAIRGLLGMQTIEQTAVWLADGTRVVVDVAGPVEMRFANRRAKRGWDGAARRRRLPARPHAARLHGRAGRPAAPSLIINPAHSDATQFEVPCVIREVAPGYARSQV